MGVKKWFLASSLAHMDYLIKYFIIFMNRIYNSYDTKNLSNILELKLKN